MTSQELKDRTQKLAVDAILFCEALPKKTAYFIIEKQLIRCASSVGTNYRAACKAKSPKDFIYKLEIVEEEADETIYWLEIVQKLGIVNKNLNQLKVETNEILSIIIAGIKTSKKRLSQKRIINQQSEIKNPKFTPKYEN